MKGNEVQGTRDRFGFKAACVSGFDLLGIKVGAVSAEFPKTLAKGERR